MQSELFETNEEMHLSITEEEKILAPFQGRYRSFMSLYSKLL